MALAGELGYWVSSLLNYAIGLYGVGHCSSAVAAEP
jgi:hypothetical protein